MADDLAELHKSRELPLEVRRWVVVAVRNSSTASLAAATVMRNERSRGGWDHSSHSPTIVGFA
jgi:hypothetical protein